MITPTKKKNDKNFFVKNKNFVILLVGVIYCHNTKWQKIKNVCKQ